jgi:hypothetical protein
MATIDDVKASYLAINRTALNDATAAAVAAQIDGGTLTLATYQTNLIEASTTTTKAAVALSSFVQGTVPSSEKVDSLTAFAKLQADYYANTLQSAHSELGAYEALGKAYAADAETSAAFAAKYGALSATNFVNFAYGEVFNGAIPSAAALANLVGQIDYFTKLYTDAGIPAADAALQAKGAVLGQIIGYAFTLDPADLPNGGSPMVPAVDQTLQTAADEAVAGTPVEDSAVYGQPLSGAGNAIQIAADDSLSLDIAAGGNKATTFNDTVTGTIENANAVVSVNTAAGNDSIGTYTGGAYNLKITENVAHSILIDGSAGEDSLYAELGSDLTDVTTVTSVEKVFVDGAGFSIDAKNWSGVKEFWSSHASGALTVTNIGSELAATLGVDTNGANDTTFELAEEGVATVALRSVTQATIELTNATSLTLNVLSNSTTTLDSSETTALTITGAGNITINGAILAQEYESIDASAATGKVALLNQGASAADSTIKLSAQADTLSLALDSEFNVGLTTGAGADTVTVLAGGNVNADLSSLATVTDFKVSEDKIDVAAIAGGGEIANIDQTVIDGGTLEAALNYLAGLAGAANEYAAFEFGADTFIYLDTTGDNTFSAGDTLIKLTGVSGAVVGTDIIVA